MRQLSCMFRAGELIGRISPMVPRQVYSKPAVTVPKPETRSLVVIGPAHLVQSQTCAKCKRFGRSR
jgi:hypothetical protein